MMAYIKKSVITIPVLLINLIAFVFSLNKDTNVALKKQVIGTVAGLKVLTDGISKKDNFAEFTGCGKQEQYFIIVLGQAKYIRKIRLLWVEGYEPAVYKVEASG